MTNRKNQKVADSIVYVATCILSLGSVWIMRVIITKALQYAREQKDL